jgi:hypothetical protein
VYQQNSIRTCLVSPKGPKHQAECQKIQCGFFPVTCERIRAAVEWLAAYFAPAARNSAVVFCVIQVRREA